MTKLNNMKVERLGETTKNLDNKRIPLNSMQREGKSKEGLYPYIGANNIMGYINEYIFDEKILCIAEDGGSWGAGQICANIYSEKCWVNNHAHVLIENGKANLEYLRYFLNKEDLNKYITGSTRGKLTKSALEDILVPLPSLSDQLHIANLLTKAENLISQRKQSIALLDEFLKSTFLDMFGDPVGNEKMWVKLKLSDVCTKIGSGATPRGGKESYHKSGMSLIRSLNVHNDIFLYKDLALIDDKQAEELKNVSVEGNDVLLNITGASVARCCIVPCQILPARVNQHVSIVRPNPNILNPVFLSRMFTNNACQSFLIRNSKSKGATREAITKDEIERFEVIAPNIELQIRFAQIVERTEALKTKYLNSLQDLENLYGSLSQRAFRGELTLLMPESQESMAANANTKYEVGKGAGIQPRICNSPEKAILAGHIIYQTNNEHFGRVKFQKLLHLTSYFCKVDVDSNFTKKAAGPHDGHLIADIESTLSRFQFYDIKQSNLGNHRVNYTPLSAVSDLEDIYKGKFEAEKERIDSFLEKFKKSSWEQCEIVSTLYAVWNNRIIKNEDVSDDALKQDFLNWDAQNVKYKDRLDKALQWMRDEGVIPDGWGKLIE